MIDTSIEGGMAIRARILKAGINKQGINLTEDEVKLLVQQADLIETMRARGLTIDMDAVYRTARELGIDPELLEKDTFSVSKIAMGFDPGSEKGGGSAIVQMDFRQAEGRILRSLTSQQIIGSMGAKLPKVTVLGLLKRDAKFYRLSHRRKVELLRKVRSGEYAREQADKLFNRFNSGYPHITKLHKELAAKGLTVTGRRIPTASPELQEISTRRILDNIQGTVTGRFTTSTPTITEHERD